MRPERGPTRIGGGDAVDRIVRQRHQQIDAEHERHAETQEAVVKKPSRSLARQARPDEQAGQEEHQVHQIDVLERTEQVEAEPAVAVDDRLGRPIVRRAVEGARRSIRLRAQIGDEGMEGQHHQDGVAPLRHARATCPAGSGWIGRTGASAFLASSTKAHSRNSGYSLIAANPSGAMLRHGGTGESAMCVYDPLSYRGK
jgi:hypothetical protein